MSINKSSNNSTQQQQPAQPAMAGAFEHAQQRQAPKAPEAGAFSFRSMGKLSNSAMGRTPASEVLSKTKKALDAIYEEAADKNFEVNCIPLDMNQTTMLSVSALIVALRDGRNPDLGVAYHTLILEASIEAVAPRFELINGVNTEIVRTVGEAFNDTMIQEVAAVVGRIYPNSNLIPASACVVPRDFNITDQGMAYTLASNALFAASSELETNHPEFHDLNLINAERDSSLTVRTTFGNAQVINAVGQPVRSDIVIDFSAAPTGQNQDKQQVERITPISRSSGFVDLVWDPVANQVMSGWGQPIQQQSYVRYAARFVCTALESTSLLTINAQLLALIPSLSLLENNQWIQSFRQQNFSSEIDMHDIGAVGIEANFENNATGLGNRINTSSDSFRPEDLHRLVAMTIKPGLYLSLDVPECGPETWYNGVFAAAAAGNSRANQAIVDSANMLTNDAFGKYYQGGQVCKDDNNRIHTGHYGDRNGVRKDIRDIDYLAILNLAAEKDPEVIQKWSDSFLLTNIPQEVRLANRKRIITALFSDVVFTGFARRVTFEPTFIEALAKACQDVGLVIRPVSTYADVGSYERAVAGFSGHALMSGETTGVFNRGYSQTNQVFGNSRTFGGGNRGW